MAESKTKDKRRLNQLKIVNHSLEKESPAIAELIRLRIRAEALVI